MEILTSVVGARSCYRSNFDRGRQYTAGGRGGNADKRKRRTPRGASRANGDFGYCVQLTAAVGPAYAMIIDFFGGRGAAADGGVANRRRPADEWNVRRGSGAVAGTAAIGSSGPAPARSFFVRPAITYLRVALTTPSHRPHPTLHAVYAHTPNDRRSRSPV